MTNNALSALSRRTQEAHCQVLERHKTFQSALSRYGKLLDKRYRLDLDSVGDAAALHGTEQSMLEAVCLHFLVHGQFDLADKLIQESVVDVPAAARENYVQLFEILTPLKERNLAPALSWAQANTQLLADRTGRQLEFALHRLQYLHLLSTGDVQAAVAYARAHFSRFGFEHLKDIQRLMGASLYASRLESSPYAGMLGDQPWLDVERLFREEYCAALGLPSDSPLYTSIAVGTTAIPSIIKMSQVVRTNRTEWTQQDELPVSIPMPDAVRFHSTFVCPVSKDYGTPENPPMRLPCGHVIGHESLMKLSNHDQTRFKCPYCPSEASASQAMRVYF
ncbi:CTLH/CRA C-terminal to lish motif domain-containing protein [Thamnocephalis sphaerospora]|uniref:GID complex catalytic subunit 2 n=1 Tax=Thamnocephalis sphaerospora TaxID=78915 RepID=A0A4P9XN65_9FUNG|nr:CTLH/CRA C-terminal to lish motif domain-containing protein [Thamnocephalis sphaerospora]|eukprot:RKP07355.1 CTLH/CRA C-terminal to lish motif domain-containing protein [Thamnocephalis sphaerospora]